MPKYFVTGYLVTSYTTVVSARDEEEAYEKGEQILDDGGGIQGDSAWQAEYDIELDTEGSY